VAVAELACRARVRLAGSAGVQASTTTMWFSSASPAITQGSVRSGIGVVLRACPGKEQREEETIDDNLLLCRRSTPSSDELWSWFCVGFKVEWLRE
jgi:hypothetical protein